MMQGDLITYLRQDATIKNLVGNRVTPVSRYGTDLPAVTVTRISGNAVLTMAGPSSLRRSRVQVDCWAESWTTAQELASAVDAALTGMRGQTLGQTEFQEVALEAVRETKEGGTAEPGYPFRSMLDFMIWHKPAEG